MKGLKSIQGITTNVKTPCGNLYVTCNIHKDRVVECFVHMGKAGGCESAFNEGIARMISLHLRGGGDIQGIVAQLIEIKCNKGFLSIKEKYLSCLDSIAKILLDVESDLSIIRKEKHGKID